MIHDFARRSCLTACVTGIVAFRLLALLVVRAHLHRQFPSDGEVHAFSSTSPVRRFLLAFPVSGFIASIVQTVWVRRHFTMPVRAAFRGAGDFLLASIAVIDVNLRLFFAAIFRLTMWPNKSPEPTGPLALVVPLSRFTRRESAVAQLFSLGDRHRHASANDIRQSQFAAPHGLWGIRW